MTAKIETRHQWLDKLGTLSPLIKALNLKKQNDYVYAEHVGKILRFHDTDAYNLSNSEPHDELIVRAISGLQGKTTDAALSHMLGELTFRKTYGAFCELAAYDWLARAGVDFTPQVQMAPTDVLNPNGSTLDGKIGRVGKSTVYFDVKGFGFHAHKIKILNERLNKKFSNQTVLVEGAWDVSVDSLQELLDYEGFTKIIGDLKKNGRTVRGPLEIRLQKRRAVTMSAHSSDPKQLAAENKAYPLRFASQFARNSPFLLLFVIHPWFSQGELHQNFAGFVDAFGSEFAKLVFHSFSRDNSDRYGIPTSEAIKLLSGFALLNVWPEAKSAGKGPSSRIYLNPVATHPLDDADFAIMKAALGIAVTVEIVT